MSKSFLEKQMEDDASKVSSPIQEIVLDLSLIHI